MPHLHLNSAMRSSSSWLYIQSSQKGGGNQIPGKAAWLCLTELVTQPSKLSAELRGMQTAYPDDATAQQGSCVETKKQQITKCLARKLSNPLAHPSGLGLKLPGS